MSINEGGETSLVAPPVSAGVLGPDQLPRHLPLLSLFIIVLTFSVTITGINLPGVTVDEPINVGHGKAMANMLLRQPHHLGEAGSVYRLFRHAHEHPPLTRLLVGLSHALLDPIPDRREMTQPKLGRPASAIAWALLAGSVTYAAGVRAGLFAGFAAAVSILSMPRLFAHGRLASPEMILAFLFTVALLLGGRAIDAWNRARWQLTSSRIPWRYTIDAGLACGAALLCKLTAVLAVGLIVTAMLVAGRLRALLPILVVLAISLSVFVGGWPWLWPFDFPGDQPGWLGTVDRLIAFARVGLDRATIYVKYFGTQYPHDGVAVPASYPWFFFLTTIPIAVHLLAMIGAVALCRHGIPFGMRLPAVAVPAILFFFSGPVERYDGERLFLMVFPLWAIVAGYGAAYLCGWYSAWRERRPWWVRVAVIGLLTWAVVDGLRPGPFGLAYFNQFTGGIRGAERVGMEIDYWGVGLTERLLDQLAESAERGDSAILLPSLHSGHAPHLSTPLLQRKGITVLSADHYEPTRDRWAIVFHRGGYLDDPLPRQVMTEGTVVAEESYDGVWLARIYALPEHEADADKPATGHEAAASRRP